MPDSKRDIAKVIAEEHAALKTEIRNLEADLNELDEGLEGEPARQLLLEDLRLFREHLRRHFQLEEQNGYLPAIAGKDPGTQREIDDLVAEHRRFETDTDDLLERLGDAQKAARELAGSFRTALRAMLARLAIHESKENALFQRVLGRDIGGAD
jgi:iron-sulfur cluster repair protein YtfE (RIC family)